jgi:ribosome-binding protein aMBF1 (putative translation factor)
MFSPSRGWKTIQLGMVLDRQAYECCKGYSCARFGELAMIRNEREYKITKSSIAKFKRSLAQIDKRKLTTPQSWGGALSEQAIRTIVGELEEDVRQYEQLKNGMFSEVSMSELVAALPVNLIRARIAVGWTQKDLAKKLGTSEQQIQKYEATDYQSASLGRITEIAALFREECARKKNT